MDGSIDSANLPNEEGREGEKIEKDIPEPFHPINQIEQKHYDCQNNILISVSDASLHQEEDQNIECVAQEHPSEVEGKRLVCFHERTSSCESTVSSLSASSYNSSSNASGILLSVSSLGPPPNSCQIPKSVEAKFNICNSTSSTSQIIENIINTSTTQLNSKTASIIVEKSEESTCDSGLGTAVTSKASEKQILCAIARVSTDGTDNRKVQEIHSDKKSKKLFDFSVIKLRGRNILLHKHESLKMGQSATADAQINKSNNINKISHSDCNSERSNMEGNDSSQLHLKNYCDSSVDDTDTCMTGRRPEPEGHDLISDIDNISLPKVDITKSAAFLKLQAELESAQKDLKLKEDEVLRLSRIRDEVESEMHDLTASLFQEAHRMVGEANEKRVSTEKSLVEASMKIDGLETEVAALKTLVLTSTPSQPNRHLHPQLAAMDHKNSSQSKSNGHGSNNSLLQG